MSELCLSSELYPVSPADIGVLEDADIKNIPHLKDRVVVLIGNLKTGEKDKLLCGREIINKALENKKSYIRVRFAFFSKFKRFDFISMFIKPLRLHKKFESSNIYHINPNEIRKLKIERNIRNKENAYALTNPKFYLPPEERKRLYDKLYNSMKKGYDDQYPLDIMLLRMMGIKDTVNQGHHRMGIAMDLKLPLVAVRFSAAGGAPRFLHPLLKIIADINIRLKLWNKKQ